MHERRKQPPDSFTDEVAAMKKDLDKVSTALMEFSYFSIR